MPQKLDSNHNFSALRRKIAKAKPSDELPVGYSPTSSASYYNEESALALKVHLDSLNPNDKSRSKSFPVTKYKSVNTIYQQVYLGFRYLVEKMDPTGKYADLRKQLSISRHKDRVILFWSSRALPTLGGVDISLQAEDLQNPDIPLGWKDELMRWIEVAADGETRDIRINLSIDEIEWIKSYLMSFPNFVPVRITASGYKITNNAKLAAAIREERGE